MADGNGAQALREMAEGKGVIISKASSKFGATTNDSLELLTPSERSALKSWCIYVDYSSDVGSVLLDRALYNEYWRDELLDAFDLWLEPGRDQSRSFNHPDKLW